MSTEQSLMKELNYIEKKIEKLYQQPTINRKHLDKLIEMMNDLVDQLESNDEEEEVNTEAYL